MRNLVIYIHGKGGNSEEAEHYKPFFHDVDVIGFDYNSENPWEAEKEFSIFYDLYSKEYDSIILIANSIGAYFSLLALADKKIDKALLISPVVNMEELITNMMMWANVSEKELLEKKKIVTDFGETLSWEYLCIVRDNTIKWKVPTEILYAGKDTLTSRQTVDAFIKSHNANLTVFENGEHWFHTDEQLSFLNKWIVTVMG